MGLLLLLGIGLLPELRAVGYLAREVPNWARDNRCHSCHNNGDGARALVAARRLSYALPPKTLDDTTAWLTQPGNWLKAREKQGDADSDKELTYIQFGAALADALDAGLTTDRQSFRLAASRLAELQRADGTWAVDSGALVGTPTTYGPALAAHQARRILLRADARQHAAAIARTDRWFRKAPVPTILDAAAITLALEGAGDAEAGARRRRCRELLLRGEARGGGWGPHADSQPEPFDTAVVLLALARNPADRDLVARGRTYLIRMQRPDGSWPATTRPAGGDSYAQHLSTTGWATLALLHTR